MPQARDPDPISPHVPVKPLFAACGKQMRLVLSQPSAHYCNLVDCIFECICGERGNYVIAHAD